jgi:hypothetical protein
MENCRHLEMECGYGAVTRRLVSSTIPEWETLPRPIELSPSNQVTVCHAQSAIIDNVEIVGSFCNRFGSECKKMAMDPTPTEKLKDRERWKAVMDLVYGPNACTD